MRRYAVVCALAWGMVPSAVSAFPLTGELPSAPRVLRDRFRGTWSVGASTGIGGPRGFAGAFVEARPWRALSVGVGGGFGGAFGPAVDVTVGVAPLGGRAWALGLEGSFANHFSYARGEVVTGRPPLPGSTQWLGLGLTAEVRPSRGVLLRVGLGRAWLLNTGDFRLGTANEVANVELSSGNLPAGVTPLDAVRAAANDETLGVWYVHLDIAPAWRW